MVVKGAVVLAMLVSSFSVAAQPASRSKHNPEQTSFGAEDAFRTPVELPAAALQALRDAKDPYNSFQDCADGEGIGVSEIPAAWFVASEIRLGRLPGSGLIVRSEWACFWGAHVVQFWVIARSAAVYKVLLTTRADALDVLPTCTNGYRDLQLVFLEQAGRYIDYVKLRYSNGTYHKSGQGAAGSRRGARIHSPRAVAITEVRNADPMLGAEGGTVVLEVSVNATGAIGEVEVARGIEGLTAHVIQWVLTWKWKPATLSREAIASVITVAVTVSPAGCPSRAPALSSHMQSPNRAEELSPLHPPRVISAIFPECRCNSLPSGAVALRVGVDETGELGKVTVVNDVPPLTAASIESLRMWKFAPASLEGEPISAEVILAFVCEPQQGTGHEYSTREPTPQK